MEIMIIAQIVTVLNIDNLMVMGNAYAWMAIMIIYQTKIVDFAIIHVWLAMQELGQTVKVVIQLTIVQLVAINVPVIQDIIILLISKPVVSAIILGNYYFIFFEKS